MSARERLPRGASASASVVDAARADLAAEAVASAERGGLKVGGKAVDSVIGGTSAALGRAQECRPPRNPTLHGRILAMSRAGELEAQDSPKPAVAAGDDELAAAVAQRIDGLDAEELRALASALDDRLSEQILADAPGRADLDVDDNEGEDELEGDELEGGGE